MKKCKLYALGLLTLVMMAALAVIPVINPAQSANADALTLLGTTDTNDDSHWEDFMATPVAVQGDNNWWIYEGHVEGTLVECTATGNWWKNGENWSGTYYRGQYWVNTYGVTAAWKAPANGTVAFNGHLKVNVLGDGFTFKFYNEKAGVKTLIETVAFDEATDAAYFSGVELEVVKGETYYFEMSTTTSTEAKAEVRIWPDFEEKVGTSEITLLGATDTNDDSHWEDFMATPVAVQGDNNWWIYEGNVQGTLVECTATGNWWKNGGNWSGAYFRGQYWVNTYSVTTAWKAPADGTVAFNGHFKVLTLGDGFTFKIYNEKAGAKTLIDTVVFDETTDVAYLSGIKLEVVKGEIYYFEMSTTTSTEAKAQVRIWPDFNKTVVVAEDTLIGTSENWDEEAFQVEGAASAWYPCAANTQGSNNWYAYYGSVTNSFNELSYQSGNYWIGNQSNWTGVWFGHVGKTIVDALILGWKAPHTGTVAFNGRAASTTNLGREQKDFILNIYKSTAEGVVLWDNVTVKAGDVVYLNDVAQNVKAGDVFYFEFDAVDNTETDITIHIKPTYTVTAEQATISFGDEAEAIDCYVDDIVELPVLTKEGYTFNGWTANEEVYTGKYVVTGNATFTASWTINKYTVSFEGCEVTPIEVTYGEQITVESPVKEGYTFSGWTLNGEAYTLGAMPAENITLVANWAVNKYTVSIEGCEVAPIEVA